MHLKNCRVYCELTSENPIEDKALLTACRRSYSPRMCGITQSENWRVVLAEAEISEFMAGVLRDVDISNMDKWAICKLLSCWASGEIKDEAVASDN